MAPQTIDDLLKAEAARIDALHGERRSHELVKFAIAAPAIAAIEHRLAQSLEVSEAEIELVQKRFGAVAANFLRSVGRGAAAGARTGATVGGKVGAAIGAIPGTIKAAAGHAIGGTAGTVAGGAAGAAVGAAAGAAKHVAPAVARGSKALAGYYQRARAKAGDIGAAAGEKAFVGSAAHRQAMHAGGRDASYAAIDRLSGSNRAAFQRRIADTSKDPAMIHRGVDSHRTGSVDAIDSGVRAAESKYVASSRIGGAALGSRVARGEAAAHGRRVAHRAFDAAGGLTAAIAGGAAAYGAYRAAKDGRAGRDADGDGKLNEGKKA